MVDISIETPAKTEQRLRQVIQQSTLEVLDGHYVFDEFPLKDFADRADEHALALVRDNEVWSQLVAAESASQQSDQAPELFKIFLFHFDKGGDNSGFVGWLATHLKRKLGTGVIVICGNNSQRSGVFDYYGCPASLGAEVIQAVRKLMTGELGK